MAPRVPANRERNLARRRAEGKRARIRKAMSGECASCSRPAEPGFSQCALHLELARASARDKRRAEALALRGFRRVHRCRKCGEPGHRASSCDRIRKLGVAA